MLEEKQLEFLKNTFEEQYKNIEKLHILKNNGFKQIKQFALFLTLCGFVLALGFAYEAFYEKKVAQLKPEKISVFPVMKSQTIKLVLVIESINSLKLQLDSLQLNDKTLSLSLKHSNKNNLIEFLTQYQCEVKTLQYNKKENLYELSATFQLS